jgi:hypothetical protein
LEPYNNTTAGPITITTNDTANGGGTIRVVVFYIDMTEPTS